MDIIALSVVPTRRPYYRPKWDQLTLTRAPCPWTGSCTCVGTCVLHVQGPGPPVHGQGRVHVSGHVYYMYRDHGPLCMGRVVYMCQDMCTTCTGTRAPCAWAGSCTCVIHAGTMAPCARTWSCTCVRTCVLHVQGPGPPVHGQGRVHV